MEMLYEDCLETTPCSNVDYLRKRNELTPNGIQRTQGTSHKENSMRCHVQTWAGEWCQYFFGRLV